MSRPFPYLALAVLTSCAAEDDKQCGTCVEPPAACVLPWGGEVASGAEVTAWQASSVACGEACLMEQRACTNGGLAGAYVHPSCTVAPCAAAPTVAAVFAPNPAVVGEAYTLTTSTTDATSLTYTCTGPRAGTGALVTGQSQVVSATAAPEHVGTTTCELTASGPHASAQATAVLVVVPRPPTVYFDSNEAWPPTFANNPTSVIPGFALGLFAKCGDDYRDTIPGTAPALSSVSVTTPEALTGLAQSPVQSLQCASPAYNELGESTFFQLDDETRAIGIWLNPTRLREGTLASLNPGFNLDPLVTPWSSATAELALQWDMKLPHMAWLEAHPAGPVVPYVPAYITIQHPEHDTPSDPGYHVFMWYGAGIFDPRGPTEYIGWDPGTNAAIVGQPLNGSATFLHKGPGSDDATATTFATARHFDWRISRADLVRGLVAYNERAEQHGWPLWPTDAASVAKIKLTSWTFNHETADHVPQRYDRLRLAVAHSSASFEVPLGIWYQRQGLVGFQFGVATAVPAGWSGFGALNVDLRAVGDFAGVLTRLAVNPYEPNGLATRFGFDWAALVDPYDGSAIASWALDSSWPADPMPGAFDLDGAHFERFNFDDVQSTGAEWTGQVRADGSSFQWAPAPIVIDPTAMLGASYWNIRLVQTQE